jgi:predicted nucleotidyltransferase
MDPRSLTKDFREFLQCLNEHGVEYVVIGGHAVAYHGYPRRISANLDGVQVHFIGLADLKSNKKASGRNRDLADLDELA